jgi:ribonuclease P protein component
MAKRFTLKKDERLKSRKQLEQLFAGGKKITVAPFRISYSTSPSEKPVLQFGVGVSSKNFKKAVDRNRIKRLVREAWRLAKNDPIAIGLKEKVKTDKKQVSVFFIYTGKELPDYKLVSEKVNNTINKLIQLV